MDLKELKELLSAHRYYSLKDPDKELHYHFELREATNLEHLEFRQRSAKVKVRNGKIESSVEASNAPLWLLDKIKVKVECSNGTSERVEVPDDMFLDINERVRMQVINRYLLATEGEEAEVQKNSQGS